MPGVRLSIRQELRAILISYRLAVGRYRLPVKETQMRVFNTQYTTDAGQCTEV